MKALILAAGKGTRMRSEKTKVMHEILGRPMLSWVLNTLQAAGIRSAAAVIGSGGDQVRAFLKKTAPSVRLIHQKEQLGTGHAVMTAKAFFPQADETVLIAPGDMPLVTSETLKRFIAQHQSAQAAASVLSALNPKPYGYGRILREDGQFSSIREESDATDQEKKVQEVNTGVYLFHAGKLFEALQKIKPLNAKKEFYLTDTIEVLIRSGYRVEAFALASAEEAEGINARKQLAYAIKILALREAEKHMDQGVTIEAPDQTWISPDAVIGQDTEIYPWTSIESGVKIGKRCKIGPFAKIRRGSEIGDDAIVGSFVEINRSKLGKGVFAKHLAYLGDAVIGDGTNVGAGVITANYDGVSKHSTRVGKKVLLGSNTVIVAPVVLEDGVRTGAGSVVTAGTKVRKGNTVVGVPARPLPKALRKA